MIQEDKELLLKDLCARLPYGVHVLVHDTFEYSTVPFNNTYLKASDISDLIDSISLDEGYNKRDKRFNRIIKDHKDFLEFKPCLFPLSSMTEKEKKELNNVLEFQYYSDDSCMCESTDWLNAHHFDYRGLIEKGLAIDATGLNIYKITS